MPKRTMSKSAKIRRALTRGESVATIVAKYDTTPSMVYNIRSSMKRKEQKPESTIIVPPTPDPVPSGIITLSDPAPMPPGGITVVMSPPTVEPKPSLWARFKLWAFGFRR
jgi:hypothetical protein